MSANQPRNRSHPSPRAWSKRPGDHGGWATRLLLTFLILLPCPLLRAALPPPASPPVLEEVRDVIRLAPGDLLRTNRVSLTGILTYHDPARQLTFLQDETGACALSPSPQSPELHAGVRVRVAGVVASFGSGRRVHPELISPLGEGDYPAAAPASPQLLFGGGLEGQWVRLSGVVRQVTTNLGYILFRTAVKGGELEGVISQSPDMGGDLIPDARVTVAGVIHSTEWDSGRPRQIRLFVPGWTHLTLQPPEDRDPFAAPLRTIQSVLQLQLSPDSAPFNRVRIDGLITASFRDGLLYVRDAHDPAGDIRVSTSPPLQAEVGDRVEVAGFPQSRALVAELGDAVVQVVGGGNALPVREIIDLDPHSAGLHEGELIQVHGRILGRADQANRTLFWAESGGLYFEAVLQHSGTPGRPRATKGSLVEFTGVCTGIQGEGRGQAFQLLLRDEKDLLVIEGATWLTTRNGFLLLGGMGAILIATVAWVVTLRRRVRKQTEQIRERLEREAAFETRFSQLVDNAPDLILTYDIGGRILSINKAGEALSRYSRREIIGKKLEEVLIGPTGLEGMIPYPSRELPAASIELSLLTRTGERIPVEARWQPIAAGGRPTEMQCIVRDIRERKRAQEALRKSEEHLRLAIDAAQMGTWEFHPATGQVHWNSWVYEQYGVTEGAFGGTVDAVLEHIHPVDREHIQRTIEVTSRTGEPFQLEYRIVRPDGQKRWRLMQGHGLRDSLGNVTRVIGISQDVTPRKQAEQALRDREEIYRAMFEKNRASKLLVEPETGEIVDANPAAAGFYGLPLPELRKMRLSQVTRGDQEALRTILRQARDGETDFFHLRQVTSSGEERDVEVFAGALRVGGRPLLFCIVLDVSDKVKAAEALRVMNQQLEARVQERTEELRQRISEVEGLNKHTTALLQDLKRAHRETAAAARQSEAANTQLHAINQELEAFSYSVSHDLRAPLRHIAGYVSILEETHLDRMDDEGKRCLATISKAAHRMAELIDDLLAFSRIGRTELTLRSIDLSTVAQELIRDFSTESRHREIEWRVQPLPQVQGDPVLLRQVLSNLLENAVKYTRPREHTVIEIGVVPGRPQSPADLFHTLYVRDNGVGFDMAYCTKLFGVFQRLHSASEFEGTGIGLANVRRIIARHGGQTWAEAEPDRGATFYFTLPREASQAASARTEIQSMGA